MQFVEDWRRVHTWLSVQIQGVVLGLIALWTQLPQDWKDAVPKGVLLALVALAAFATISGRLIKQAPKDCEKDNAP